MAKVDGDVPFLPYGTRALGIQRLFDSWIHVLGHGRRRQTLARSNEEIVHSAAKFAALKRRLQIRYTECISKGCDPDSARNLNDICSMWDELTLQSPALYKTDWPELALYDSDVRSLRADAARESHGTSNISVLTGDERTAQGSGKLIHSV